MGKNLIRKTGLVLVAFMLCCGMLRSEDYVLDFSTKVCKWGTYLDKWTWTFDEVDWELDGAANSNGGWAYVRFGGKAGKSGTSYVKSNNPMPIFVGEFLLDVKALNDVAKSNAFKLFVSEDVEFKNIIDEVSLVKDEGVLSFLPRKVSVWPASAYYKLEIYWKNGNSSGNMGIDITSLTFKEGVPPPVYEITTTVNDESLGTVSVEEKVITAFPGKCSTYAEPAYTVVAGEAEVTQSGNTFAVVPQSDCLIQINFTPLDTYSVQLDAGNGALTGDMELLQTECNEALVLPEAVPTCEDWTFAGWSESPVDEMETRPELIPSGEYLPTGDIILYAVYEKKTTGEAVQQLKLNYGITTEDWDLRNVGIADNKNNPYYILHQDASILSPSFDLSNIVNVSARIRSYNKHAILLITDEFGNEWGTATAPTNELSTTTAIQTQELSGMGRLVFTSETTTPSYGVGVSEITITCSAVPTIYHSNPICEPGSGTGFEVLDDSLAFYVEHHTVCFQSEGGKSLEVYTLPGVVCVRGETIEGMNRLNLPHGIYLLRVGEKVNKVVVK